MLISSLPSDKATFTRGHPSYKATLTKGQPSYQFRFQIYWDYKILLNFSPKRGHHVIWLLFQCKMGGLLRGGLLWWGKLYEKKSPDLAVIKLIKCNIYFDHYIISINVCYMFIHCCVIIWSYLEFLKVWTIIVFSHDWLLIIFKVINFYFLFFQKISWSIMRYEV